MGTNTTLSGLSFSANADNTEASYGEDVVGMLSVAQTMAGQLIYTLNAIVAKLPGGDPNITTLNSLITALS